ncbi:putative cyclase [Novymonas esmeraldas]|uniref:Cyclase n=1 Tax=Novymonas esmeraldas TaxID=1808958 RepID=A0AAW0F0D9_9TRYP
MRIVDLSLPVYDGMPVYPGDPPVRIARVCTRERDGWEVRRLEMGSHTATHVDAPSHMHDGGGSLDEVPLTQFFGPAVVAVVDAVSYPANVGLLFVTAVTAESVPRIVAAHPPFVGGPLDVEAERLLLSHGIVTYTDLVNVEQLVGISFTFVGLPLRIRGGDGSPVRAVAIVEDG